MKLARRTGFSTENLASDCHKRTATIHRKKDDTRRSQVLFKPNAFDLNAQLSMTSMLESRELCAQCKAVDVTKYLGDKSEPDKLELGPFQDILRRSQSCRFCELIIKSLGAAGDKRHWKPGKYPVETVYLGRYSRQVNEPRLEVWFDATSDTLPDGVWGHSTTLGQILPLPQEQNHTGGTEQDTSALVKHTACARIIGARLDYSVIRRWLANCEENHGAKCKPSSFASVEDPPLMLIDVKKRCLVDKGWDSRFVALSYVWGSAKSLQTVKGNLQFLRREYSLTEMHEELPCVIGDSINFVEALGETYLWVDSLCIVQDDAENKFKTITRMDKIYGQALLTLVALAGSDANAGLPGVNKPRVIDQSPAIFNSVRLVNRLPGLASIQQSCVWNSRAWTFQEGALAKRSLYFTEGQVYWQCWTSYASEDVLGGSTDESIARSAATALTRDVGTDIRRQFLAYESLVKQYSPRKLTYASDSLAAFSGLLSAVGDSYRWAFASALPVNTFHRSLLWSPMASATLRDRDSIAQNVRMSSCRSPTWCWTAWSGDIYWNPWRLDSYVGKDVKIIAEVEEFLFKDQDRFMKITSQRTVVPTSANDISPAIKGLDVYSRPTLVFEAKTVRAEHVCMSLPRLDPSTSAATGVSSFFRRAIRGVTWIYDVAGHHCGTLWERFDSIKCRDTDLLEFVLLSHCDQDEVTQADIEAYHDRLPLEYPSSREYFEEIFDTAMFECKPGWALNILLVEKKGDFAERVAVGQIHVDAWDMIRPEMNKVRLI